MVKGRIIKGIGGFYYVKPFDSSFYIDEIIECKPRGILRLKKVKPLVGDIVELEQEENQWVFDKIDERKNSLIRPNISNVDIALLCFAIKKPKPDLLMLDKLIVNCLYNKIEPIICFTKVDLDKKEALRLKQIYRNLGFPVILLSSKEDDELSKLTKLMEEKIAFMAGPSGVGKSTLSNRICDKKMEVGHISSKLKRGMHTTRHSELLETKYNSLLLDTPGFSSLELDEEIKEDDLKHFYPEFQSSSCYYSNCAHINEPKCSIREKVKNKEIDMDRYKRYKLLYNTLKERKPY